MHSVSPRVALMRMSRGALSGDSSKGTEELMMDLEICIDSVESAIAAANGGAERVELCSALSEGGITPSTGLIEVVRAAVNIQLFVIIRPRGGNFVYSDLELDVMRNDILGAKARGADGVVLGVLTRNDLVDIVRTRELVELARPLQVTFHRAFDVCEDTDHAFEDVIACGADRVLTSGGKVDAIQGMSAIAYLQQRATNRIRIMAGGGLRVSNVRNLVLHTGIREVHTSLSANSKSAASDGGAEIHTLHSGFTPFVVREADVRAFKAVLNEISAGSVI
jgi:copper homeostasis protein